MKKNGFAPLILILVIAALGIAGYFAYKSYSLRNTLVVSTSTPIESPNSTASPLLKPTSNSDQIKGVVADYLVLKGDKKENLIIQDPILLGKHKDIYSVGWSQKMGDAAHGGTFLLIGKIDGNWVIPTDGDSNYCNWIKTAGLDEATQAFMGSSCKF